jgi:geranylgeranyl diphosphate synthase type I
MVTGAGLSSRRVCEENESMVSAVFDELSEALTDATQEVNQVIDHMLELNPKPKDLYDASRHLIDAGGKRLRPFLVLKACELVGGRREDALPFAAAVEFIHNFTLIHDDIMDNDDKRRGVATVHNLWGIPIAITAGDMLFAQAYHAILSTKSKTISSPRILQVLEVITNATIAICRGQAHDVLFETRPMISEEEYFGMIGQKTAVLLEASTQIGAIVGGGSASQVRRLGRYGYYSGVAFQIVDDILGLTADETVLGKPVGSDIREGKKTLIMISALANADPDQDTQLSSVLGNDQASPQEIEETLQLIRSLGALEYASKTADHFIEKAKQQLAPFPPSSTKETLLTLADYILSRTY